MKLINKVEIKGQEEKFNETGKVPSGVPTIYNQNAVEYIVKALKN